MDNKIKIKYPFEPFISAPIKSFPSNNYNKNTNAKQIVNIELNKKNPDFDKIYDDLTNSILQYRLYLRELNTIIPDFDKIFIVSILDFRFKQTTIMNTWAFDKNFYLDYILNNSKDTEIDKEQLLNYYSFDKPIIANK